MQKVKKNIPNNPKLEYKGTSSSPDIKIFVSHRIDKDSTVINNPLFIPIRCGAAFDSATQARLIGDDTGDNISEKRLSFNEFTVIYWAWKNIRADYYGLCHYRRFLSFLDQDLPYAPLKMGLLDSMTEATLSKVGLLNEEKMREEITQFDLIVPYSYTISQIPLNTGVKTMRESWENHTSFLTSKDFDLALSLIKELSPEYFISAKEYMEGTSFIGFNCFVMKKEFFFQLCEFVFPILFAFSNEFKKHDCSINQLRAPGYLGEWLFSIFIYHLKKKKNIKIKQVQLLGFQNTDKFFPLVRASSNKLPLVPIVLTANDINRPHLAVLLNSIISTSNDNHFYDIIILQRSFGEDKWATKIRQDQNKILSSLVANKSNFLLRFFDPKDYLGILDFHAWGTPHCEEAFYLFLAPWIFENYDKVIWIQDTMLARDDLAPLMKLPIDGSSFAAAPNVFAYSLKNGYDKEPSPPTRLFGRCQYSVDLMVLNLKTQRNQFCKDNLIKTLSKKNKVTDLETLLDGQMANRTYLLDNQWNLFTFNGPDLFKLQEYVPAVLDSCFSKNPETVRAFQLVDVFGRFPHHSDWRMQNFWLNAKKSPFYEEILASSVPHGPVTLSGSARKKIIDGLFPACSRRRKLVASLLSRSPKIKALLLRMFYT